METYAYYVIANYDDCEIEVKTDSADTAISALLEHAENGAPVMVVDGFSREVYAEINCDESWASEEWILMILGWLIKTAREVEG